MAIIGRRNVLKGLAAAGSLGMVRPERAWSQQVNRITVTSYGGIWETAIRDSFVSDFKARTGVDCDILLGGPPQWISQVEANRDRPPIHVLVATVDQALLAGRRGLVDKISVAKVSNLADVPARFTEMVEGWGTCFNYGSWGLAYHADRVKTPPASLAEFVDRTAKGDWRASIPNMAYPVTPQNVIWSFADAFGGGVDNVTPAFDAVKKMKKNTIFWGGITDFLNHLETGEADIGIYADGRTWAHYDAGNKWIRFLNPKEKGIMAPIAIMKVKNAPEIAWEYVNSMLSPGPQAKYSAIMNFGVTNSKVVYPPQVKDRVTPWEETRYPPVERIADLTPQWVERWNKEIGA